MASSSPPRRSDNSDDDDYDRLMSAVTPVSAPARTRKRNANHLDSDHLDSDDAPPSSLNLALQRVNGNHLESIIAFANRKRLCPDQITAVETHFADIFQRKWHVRIVDGTVNTDSDYWILVDNDLQNIRTKARRDTTDPKNIVRYSRAAGWVHPQELPRSRRSLRNYTDICIMNFRNAFTYFLSYFSWNPELESRNSIHGM
ncbi:hypothetical protein B0H14DRAFT_2632938 [Mycena olivaceomarginata]|nr:hypothetical protein B0H14DRAFT_2632938 [Mycena olivaceomarginata]